MPLGPQHAQHPVCMQRCCWLLIALARPILNDGKLCTYRLVHTCKPAVNAGAPVMRHHIRAPPAIHLVLCASKHGSATSLQTCFIEWDQRSADLHI